MGIVGLRSHNLSSSSSIHSSITNIASPLPNSPGIIWDMRSRCHIQVELPMVLMVQMLVLHEWDMSRRQMPESPLNFITAGAQHHTNTTPTILQHLQIRCESLVLYFLAIHLFHSTIMYSWDDDKNTLDHHYVVENKTLQDEMALMQRHYNFTAG